MRSDKFVFKAHSIVDVLTQEDFLNVVHSLRLKSNRNGSVFAMSASGQRLMIMYLIVAWANFRVKKHLLASSKPPSSQVSWKDFSINSGNDEDAEPSD